MAVQTRVIITFLDSYGKKTRRSFVPRDPQIADVDVQTLAQIQQDYAALSVIGAAVTRNVDVSGITESAEAKSSRQKDASITFRKSTLRQSHGGDYTFNLVEPKAAFVLPNGGLALDAPVWDDLRELFDDGAGVAGVQGDWYISDQEELIEDEEATDGFFNKD